MSRALPLSTRPSWRLCDRGKSCRFGCGGGGSPGKPFLLVSHRRERDFYQDALFGVRQLADIALRALSPAVNDPRRQYFVSVLSSRSGAFCVLPTPAKRVPCSQRSQYPGGPPTNIARVSRGFSGDCSLRGRKHACQHCASHSPAKIMELAEQLNLEEYQAFIVELMATLAAQHRIDSGVW